MPLSEPDLERDLRTALEVPLAIAVSDAPLPTSELMPGEQAQYQALGDGPRRDSWLRGRKALKRLLVRLGEGPDSSRLGFPHPRISLTHTGTVAVAVGAAGAGLAGVGVDLELGRTPRPEGARFFLTPAEQEWLNRQGPADRPTHLLRLWTIKEALYKANPQNRESTLLDYATSDPAASPGCAVALGHAGLQMRYVSLVVDDGFLSVALAQSISR